VVQELGAPGPDGNADNYNTAPDRDSRETRPCWGGHTTARTEHVS
jgi:hypothetical protein